MNARVSYKIVDYWSRQWGHFIQSTSNKIREQMKLTGKLMSVSEKNERISIRFFDLMGPLALLNQQLRAAGELSVGGKKKPGQVNE